MATFILLVRRKRLAGFAAGLLLLLSATGVPALPLTPFRYEQQAQKHCPDDTVVWLDFRRSKYYVKHQQRYGRGFDGSYVCLKEAQSSLYRRALLGSR